MPRAEAGSIKAVSNAIKAKGLTKLRFYCQICSKACRDENGYKNHIESESHLRQIQAIGGGASAAKTIDRFSDQFQKEFVALLSRRFGTRRVRANQAYQEYIQERHHLHMNATQWQSLSQFVKHLGREGIVRAEENEKGWWIEWVDNSPAALARQDALMKMNRSKVDEETRERKFLREQIERAKRAQSGAGSEEQQQDEGEQRGEKEQLTLRREGTGPIKIGIGFKSQSAAPAEDAQKTGKDAADTVTPVGAETSADVTPATLSTGTASTSASAAVPTPKPFGLKLSSNPLRGSSSDSASPATLQRPNLFKSGTSGSSRPSSSSSPQMQTTGSGQIRPALTAAERIMAEEVERKRRRENVGPQPLGKRMRM